MLCPKDNLVCNRKKVGLVEIDFCSKCNGVWLEKSEVKNLISSLATPGQSTVDEELQSWEVAQSTGTLPKDFWVEDTVQCPQDGTVMKKHYFAGTMIGVDQCQVCQGFWFDGGELHAAAHLAMPDHQLEQAYRTLLRDNIEWENKVTELKMLPGNIASMLTNPVYAIAMVGTFLVQTFIDKVIADENASNTK